MKQLGNSLFYSNLMSSLLNWNLNPTPTYMTFSLNIRSQTLVSFNKLILNTNHLPGSVLDIRAENECDTIFILKDSMLN